MASRQDRTGISTGALVILSAYIAAQMLADITSLKIALVASFSIDGGTFIYPLTFTLRDLVHKMLGKRAARTLIVTAAGINLAMAALLAFVNWLPADPSWGLQDPSEQVFRGQGPVLFPPVQHQQYLAVKIQPAS